MAKEPKQGQMDIMMAQPTPEGGQPKNLAEVFAHVLPSSKFLRNVGLETAVPKRSAIAAASVQELEVEVAAKKQVLQHLEINFMASRMSWKH
ncbi:unnamed protein product [Miscanthus lutarioriparius]|uniref:Uncharacterized protein n=1 Tax=Miscanthus lutarioriparius TaxID=422564 RepID=A0A811Q8C4_9POAL|nr:unnamed protein product [Miscanthus lutarioriparius]